MPAVSNEPDELLEQVLEDERAGALQEFREHQKIANDTAALTGQRFILQTRA